MVYFQLQYLNTSQPMQPYMHIIHDKEISRMLLKDLTLFLKDQLRIKGQKRGQKYHKLSDYYTLTAGNYHCSIGVSVLCIGVRWRWRCVSPRGWMCLGETRVFVCLLPVLMSCVRSCSGSVRPALSLWCSLVVLSRVSECAHGRWAKPSRSLACLL